ncbi:MAG: hypothetical protein ABJH82_10300 [Polaribacter sp.]|uniref:hypothetical protein n=1 Tax=Polaribacter sp. TaxID=1920175 RepID=UPI0032666B34
MRVRIAFFFTLLFSVLLITPTVISFIDNNQDIAYLIEINEEEDSKGKEGKESANDLEIKIHPTENSSAFVLNGIQKRKNVRFLSKNYTSQYPNITTPPPKFLS